MINHYEEMILCLDELKDYIGLHYMDITDEDIRNLVKTIFRYANISECLGGCPLCCN